jgi:hypothetical protein
VGKNYRFRRLLIGCAAFASAPFLAAATASAATPLLTPPEGWTHLDVPNQPAAEFSFSKSGDLMVTAEKSVSFLYRAISPSTDRSGMVLAWRWRVESGFPSTDLGAKGEDDRPLAIHLWFADKNAASVFGPLSRLFGYPHISHTITYVLGGDHPPESVIKNPYYENGAIIAIRGRQTAAGQWYSEKRDIGADLSRAFPGRTMIKPLKYISISADMDDTGGRSIARITGLTLMKRVSQ